MCRCLMVIVSGTPKNTLGSGVFSTVIACSIWYFSMRSRFVKVALVMNSNRVVICLVKIQTSASTMLSLAGLHFRVEL